MATTAKKINTAVIKRFDSICAFFYCIAVSTLLLFLFSQQHQITQLLAGVTQFNHMPSQVVQVRDVISQEVTFEQPRFHILITREVIAGNQVVISFIHPIWLLLTSPLFLLFNFVFFMTIFYTRLTLFYTINKQLSAISALELWAKSSATTGTIQPLLSQGEIADTITRLLDKLAAIASQHGKTDQLIREQVLLDTETGIGNREFFTNRLDAFLCEDDACGAVLLINYKELDVVQALYGYGHALVILESSISLLKAKLAYLNTFFIARRSEFEVAILVPGLYVSETEKLAARLLSSIDKIDFPIGINQEEGCHIGISYFTQGQQSYQIMSEADMALRSAQLQGPSQWFMYDTGEVVDESAKGSLKWRTFLQRAIENNAFVLFFQPVITSGSDEILHHEILSKVRDNEGKLISARVFLPMAKKCGLGAEVDTLVFEQTCRLLQYEKNHQDICSLNIAVDSLLDEGFIVNLFNKLALTPGIANNIIIEISEYHLVSNLNKLKPILSFLNELGIKVLADKVGQYIVSADYIVECEIYAVKLHRSIVHQIHTKGENQVFIQSLKVRCLSSNVAIYALGVETQEEWNALTMLGVMAGQGHYFTEPVAQMASAIETP